MLQERRQCKPFVCLCIPNIYKFIHLCIPTYGHVPICCKKEGNVNLLSVYVYQTECKKCPTFTHWNQCSKKK